MATSGELKPPVNLDEPWDLTVKKPEKIESLLSVQKTKEHTSDQDRNNNETFQNTTEDYRDIDPRAGNTLFSAFAE